MDGCEAAQTIRKTRRGDAKTIPIIAVTANAFAEDLARDRRRGNGRAYFKTDRFQGSLQNSCGADEK